MRRPPSGTAIPIEGLTTEEESRFLMDKQNPSAPPCAQPRIPRGITHIKVRHTTRFTVIGNYGEDVTIGDWTISTENLPRYADKEKVKPEGTG